MTALHVLDEAVDDQFVSPPSCAELHVGVSWCCKLIFSKNVGELGCLALTQDIQLSFCNGQIYILDM